MTDATTSVAWGDYDGDGYLDLAVGNDGQPNRLYHNEGSALTTSAVWSAVVTDSTWSVAWGDYDSDGDLDLAVGNAGQTNRLYRNDGGALTTSPVWSSALTDTTYSVAWGDYDGDGDLDLAVGNNGQPSRLYHNTGGILTPGAAWSSIMTDTAYSVAWGDYDGDDDLDLLVGNGGQPSRLYRNDGGALTAGAVWSSVMTDTTYSVAWGDYDGDGDLDVAVGNDGANRLYRNDRGALTTNAVWSSAEPGGVWARSVAWVDYDGDGDLDLASAGNYYQLSRNDNGVLTASAVWSTPALSAISSAAWGDFDGDDDLDLAIGDGNQPTRLYRNDNGVLTANTVWSSAEADPTYSVAWGDYDSDGYLDLAVANWNRPNRLYRNDGGSLAVNAAWSSDEADFTTSVAWGDYDGDGDLDLAVSNHGEGQPLRLYRNDGRTLSRLAIWSSAAANYGDSIAWGDYDGDGDLDLVASDPGGNWLYRNDGGTLTSSGIWFPAEHSYTYSLAWGDCDGDGDLDLITGNVFGYPNLLYLNDRGALRTSAVWASIDTDGASSVAWGDYDGDGDLDLAVGNGATGRLYRNTRAARFLPGAIPLIRVVRPGPNADFYSVSQIWSGSVPITYTLSDPQGNPVKAIRSWYSLDGGGRWYTATAASGVVTTNLGTAAYVTSTHRSTTPIPILDLSTITSPLSLTVTDTIADVDVRVNLIHTFDSDLVITLTAPFSRSALLVNRRGVSGDNFVDTVFDDEASTSIITGTAPYAGRYRPEQMLSRFDGYSPKGIWTLSVADVVEPNIGTLLSWGLTITLNSGAVYTYLWDVVGSDFWGQSDNVVFRIQAIPAVVTGTRNAIPGPYLYGSYASQTFPFRVRSSQIRVYSETAVPGNEAPGALVYRLPGGQSRGATPLTSIIGQPLYTNASGNMSGSKLELGDRLVALLAITATDTYTLYSASAAPTLTGLDAYTVTNWGGLITLTVSSANPFILFDLDVSLEWDARQDAQFMSQLQYDFQRASEFLYDWSNGQAALGRVTIYQDHEWWNDAHVRIYATNRLRPNAAQGGIVSTVITDPLKSTIVYWPGQVRMAAVWNRYGRSTGTLGQDWPRTLTHELGHYAFFLQDTYLGLTNGQITPVDNCPGAMSDPYRDDYSEFFNNETYSNTWGTACSTTLAAQETGRCDWETIKTFYPALISTTVNPGPGSLPLAVTQINLITPTSTITNLIDAPIFSLVDAAGGRYLPGSNACAFRFSGGWATDLGRPTLDQVTARGAREGDELCVYELAASQGDASRVGCETIVSNDDLLTLSPIADWQPQVFVSPITSRTVAISVTDVSIPVTLSAQLYPADAPAGAAITLTHAEGTYAGTFNLTEAAFEGYVRVWVNEPPPRRETIVSYAMGGNPGHAYPGGTPRRGGFGHAYPGGAPVLSADGQAILYGENLVFPEGEFYALQALPTVKNAPPWATVVGQAYRLMRSAGAPPLTSTSLGVGYMESEVTPGEEEWLRVYFSGNDGASWQPLSTTLDTYHNMASAATQGAGLYALMSSLEIPLYGPGWNLFSYPVRGTRDVITALLSINGQYDLVYGYQPEDRSDPYDPWKVYRPGAPDFVNDLRELEFGHGYWINLTASAPITLWLKGASAAAQAGIEGMPYPPATFYGPVLTGAGFTPTVGTLVTARVNGKVCGQVRMQLYGAQLVYAINVSADGPGSTAGCGTPGRAVTFEVRGRAMATTATWDNNGAWPLPLSSVPLRKVRLPLVEKRY
jgi:subtilisin-like proprotein convertase family protein